MVRIFSLSVGIVADDRESRQSRLELISGLLEAHAVGRQRQLQELLAEHGVEVSRSTLSRDLDRLGAHRVRTWDGAMAYVLPTAPPPSTSRQSFGARLALIIRVEADHHEGIAAALGGSEMLHAAPTL